MIDRPAFYANIRKTLYARGMTEDTVRGANAILDEWEKRGYGDLRMLAYMLATAYGEAGATLLPTREGFAKSDGAARAYVKRQGYRYAREVNGQVYYGRGLVQLTWDYNYKKLGSLLGIDLYNNPDLALQPAVAADIMFTGMMQGAFTGKKLSDYFNLSVTNWVAARRIINGMDKAELFAAHAKQFFSALRLSADNTLITSTPPSPEPALPPTSHPEKTVIAGTVATIAVGAPAMVAKANWHPFAVSLIAVAIVLLAFAIITFMRNRRNPTQG